MVAHLRILLPIYVSLCVFDVAVCRHRKRSEDTKDQNMLMQHAVKTLLGFKGMPRRDPEISPGSRSSKAAPKFMIDLYHKYKDSKIRSGRLTANTVRSIQADIGIVNQENLFVVNLTSIGRFEDVLKGEIHLYKKKMKSKHRSSNIIITTHELAPAKIRVLGEVTLPGRSRGWQGLDVTSDLKDCLGNARRTNHLLAFSFALRDENGTRTSLDLQEFVQILSRPFLIVFSNDTQEISLDHIDPHFNAADLSNTFINPESGKKEDFSEIDWAGFNERKPRRRRKHKHRSSIDNIDDDPLRIENELYENEERESNKLDIDEDDVDEEGEDDSDEVFNEDNVLLNMEIRKRKVRSIHDNKIPEDPYIPDWPPAKYNVPLTHPNILQGRVQSRRRLHDNRPAAEDADDDRNRRGRKRGRRRHRKNRDKQNKEKSHASSSTSGIPFADLWIRQTKAERQRGTPVSEPVEEEAGICGKRTLVVDFADIGWSDWIISPKSFRAQYCSGSCPFPIAQRLNPSNHATIQSLMHAVGINKRVPAPCCVPDKLSSVTLLFFDSDNNVVLKNYPGMTVESCACR